MRRFALTVFLSLCLQACGGTSIEIRFGTWGTCEFERTRWAQADRIRRGCMVESFLHKHRPVGMSATELRHLLGAPAGYAGHDQDPAYIVGPPAAGGSDLLVFMTDRQTGIIVEVRLMPQA